VHFGTNGKNLTIACAKDISKSSESDSSTLESGSEPYEGPSEESRTDNTSDS